MRRQPALGIRHMIQAVRQVELPEEPLREPLAALGDELGRVSAEIQSINSGFQVQLVETLAEMQRAMERDFRVRLDREVEAVRSNLIARLDDLRKEIDRVSGLYQTISAEIDSMIEDPTVELSRIIRQKAEQSVLRAYLDGLKYAAGLAR